MTLAPHPGGPAPRGEFDLYHDGLVHRWCATVALMGAILVPCFLVLDFFTMPPEVFGKFALYRAAVTGVVLVQLAVIRLTRPSRWSFLHGFLFTALVGGMIVVMTMDLGGFNSSYYAGLNLVVAANLLLPWRASYAAANSLVTLLMYVLGNALWGGAFDRATAVNNVFFLSSMVVAAVATATAKFELIQSEFAARAELLVANRNLERSRAELKAARDALWGEMEVAKRIQTALLPQDRHVGAYEVAARMLPAAEVGGDYYDILEAGEGRHWIAIGDVSGHGVESGLVMMMTQTSILSLVRENPDITPAGVFHEVNGVLVENISRLRAHRYMTLNVVRLTDDALTLAGKHQDVLVWRRRARAVEVISNEGTWLGIVPDTRGHVADHAVPMGPGDVALFFTDGATEAASASGEMFGESRLAAALARVAEEPLGRALEVLFAEVAAWSAQQDDDVTMLLVRHVGEVAGAQPEPHAATAAAGAPPVDPPPVGRAAASIKRR
jgi:phosphoserine phosphatase RsbU/P